MGFMGVDKKTGVVGSVLGMTFAGRRLSFLGGVNFGIGYGLGVSVTSRVISGLNCSSANVTTSVVAGVAAGGS